MDTAQNPKFLNPLRLNPLQLKTLALLQVLADQQQEVEKNPDGIVVRHFPSPHGDHFHVGTYVLSGKELSGLGNVSVWKVLERKGLIKSYYPEYAVLTSAGQSYDTTSVHKTWHTHSHHH